MTQMKQMTTEIMKNEELFTIHYSLISLLSWAFRHHLPTNHPCCRRSPACTPRFAAKCCNGRAGAPLSLCPSRAPLSSSTCGVLGLRPNANKTCGFE